MRGVVIVKEKELELAEEELKELALTPEEVLEVVPETVEIEEQVKLAYLGVPERIVCDIGRRFIYCVARTIITIVRKMCANPRYREIICKACKARRPDILVRLICTVLVRTFHCIPCMRAVVVWLCPGLVKSLFPTICRICGCW